MLMDEDIPVHQYVIGLCDACIAGEGECCWTPGCIMFMHSVDLPFHRELLTRVKCSLDNQDNLVFKEEKG